MSFGFVRFKVVAEMNGTTLPINEICNDLLTHSDIPNRFGCERYGQYAYLLNPESVALFCCHFNDHGNCPLQAKAEQEEAAEAERRRQRAHEKAAEEEKRKREEEAQRAAEQKEINEFCAKYGSDVKTPGRDGVTLLQKAIWENAIIAIVKYLVSQGADVNATGTHDKSPLFLATVKENVEVVHFLVSKKADIHAIDKSGSTALHAVAYAGNVAIANILVDKGADVNAKDVHDGTPLHRATLKNKNIDIVKFLVSKKADIRAKNNNGKTPLDVAREKGNTEIAEYLAKKASIWKQVCFASLVVLCLAIFLMITLRPPQTKQPTTVSDNQPIEVPPATPDVSNGNGFENNNPLVENRMEKPKDRTRFSRGTPMHNAATDGDVEMMKLLLEQGADVNIKTMGGTPMFEAAWGGHIEAMKWLKEHGADVNAKNIDGKTPMFDAARGGQIEAMKWLKEQGADVNPKGVTDRQTPMFYAAMGGQVEAMKWLKEQDLDVNVKDFNGNTPLHFAISFSFLSPANSFSHGQRVESVEYLISLGADVNAKNSSGKTPLDGAGSDVKMREILLKAGGKSGSNRR